MSRKSQLVAASPILLIAFVVGSGCVGEVSQPPGIGDGTGQGTTGSGNGGTTGTSDLTGSFGGNSAITGSGTGTAGVTGGSGLSGGGVAGTTGTGGVPGTGAGGSGGTSSGTNTSGVPCDVQTLLSNRCLSCHGTIPAQVGLPSLVTRANLMAPSRTDPNKSNAELAVTRMQNAAAPMPPAPASRATTTEIATLSNWIAAGYPAGSCGGGTAGAGGSTGTTGSGGGTGTGGVAGGSDPFSVAPKCTSMVMWTRGNQGSASMNPGMACINCHSTGEGPRFTIAGTLYPTGHEPDRCNGVNSTAGAQVVIIGADGRMVTLTPNSAGNFYSQTTIATPFQAKVVYMGRERVMIAKQTSGDCNSCHTQNGASAAPGRIVLP